MHRDTVQNLAIVLLSISAVFLFARTQIDTLAANGSYLDQLIGTPAGPNSTSIPLTDLSAPVRAAVTDAYGRHGDLCLTTGSESFVDLGILLKSALESAGKFAACESSDFWGALDETCVYYDFLEALPLSVLAGLVGGDSEVEAPKAQCLILANGGASTAQLWLWDGSEDYFSASCSLPASELENLTVNRDFGSVFFGFDEFENGPRCLLPVVPPELPALSAANSLTGTDAVLTALGFIPNTHNRYTESSGTEVIIENDRSLRIRTDGTLIFRSGSDPLLRISAANGEVPTAVEAVMGTGGLLAQLFDGRLGEAQPYLSAITQTDSVTVLEYGCHVNGLPIRFPNGGSLCSITLSGTAVTALKLQFRQYTAAGKNSLLLPTQQALAISAAHNGGTLSIGYADSGGESVDACWLSD